MWCLLGLVLGAVAGAFVPLPWPAGASVYIAMIAVSTIDAVIGGGAARDRGDFSPRVFFEGLLMNSVFSCAFAYLGNRLGAQLHLAAATALALRIFDNLAKLRQGREVRPFLAARGRKTE